MLFPVGDNDNGVVICGDVFFRLINSKTNKQICRFAINTSFIKPGTKKYSMNKWGVDPDSIAKSKDFDMDFKIELNFKDVCKKCSPTMMIKQLCDNCKKGMKEDIKEWEQVNKFIEEHQKTCNELK